MILNIKICNNKLPQSVVVFILCAGCIKISVAVPMIWKDLNQIRGVVHSICCTARYQTLCKACLDETFPDHM
jgi:hypothetical protein